MGSKKKIHVSSVTYNLAGPEDPNAETFLKTNLFAAVKNAIGNAKVFVGDTITQNYLNGPGVKLRLFQRWAKKMGYNNLFKISGGNITLPSLMNPNVIKSAINPADPNSVELLSYEYDIADYGVWAMQYMAQNHPDLFNGHWSSEYYSPDNRIIINLLEGPPPALNEYGEAQYPDEFRPVIIDRLYFTPTNYVPSAKYIYAAYMDRIVLDDGPVEQGQMIVVPVNEIPSLTDFTLVTDNMKNRTYDLTDTQVTVSTYSDGRPPTTSTETAPSSTTQLVGSRVYEKVEYIGSLEEEGVVDDIFYSDKLIRNIQISHWVDSSVSTTTESVSYWEEGVLITRTDEITTTIRSLGTYSAYRDDLQKVSISGYSATKVFIYRIGSGKPALDALSPVSRSVGEFFPFIPVRIQGTTLNSSHGWEYRAAKIAFNKATKANYDDVRRMVNRSPSLGDIDSAFITFGVPLNVKNNAGKAYLYKFFQMILEGQSNSAYAAWEQQVMHAHADTLNWEDWRAAQKDPNHPRFNTDPPKLTAYPTAPSGSMRITSDHWAITHDITIKWSYIAETYIEGLYRPGAKQGQYWISRASGTTANTFQIRVNSGVKSTVSNYNSGGIMLVWQESPQLHRVILVKGLRHENIIYKDKGVTIQAEDAVNSSSDTGFVIPLHEKIYKEISLINATEISKSCAFITFNSYKVTRTKWYQSGAFKIFVVIGIVVISVFFPPAGGIAGGAGVLGSNIAVGAAIGATATSAAIIGAAANALAAIAITHIIVQASVKLFGEEIGVIVGTMAAMYAIQSGTNMQTGQGWGADFSQLMRADNLIKLTDSVANGITQNLNQKSQEIMAASAEIQANYEKETQVIKDLWEQNIGSTDPNMFELASQFNFNYEPPNNFLFRTLMTGSDIANLTQKMIEDFAKITTDLTLS